jgi:hypothetical protein
MKKIDISEARRHESQMPISELAHMLRTSYDGLLPSERLAGDDEANRIHNLDNDSWHSAAAMIVVSREVELYEFFDNQTPQVGFGD